MSITNKDKIRLFGSFPDENLELFVAGFWEIEAQNINPGRHIIIPDGRMGVIIEITNSSSWLIGKKRWNGNIVIGQQTAPVALYLKTPFYRAFGITFTPWGATPFFGSSLDKYKNRAIPVHELLDPNQEKELRECKDFADRVNKASAFLTGLLTTKKIDIRLVNSVKKLMDNFHTPLSEITSESSTSLRNLEIVARKQFGISLTRFRRIFRLHKTIRAIKANPQKTLTEIALEMGYFDQAHMNRDFSALTGFTPASVIKAGSLSLTMSGIVAPDTAELIILPTGRP